MAKAKTTVEKEAKSRKAESVEEILAKAKATKYDMLAFARGARRSLAAVRSERYEWNRTKSTIDSLAIHYFRTPGETLTGILGPAEFELWKGVSYRLILDDGSVVRLPGNRQLNRLIKDSGCVYLRVRIEYLGKRWLTTRHYEKCYAIHPAPLKDESILDTKAGRETMAKLGLLHQSRVNRRPTKANDTRTAEQKKDARRKFLKHMSAAGHNFAPATLREFKGEPWAEKAIEEASK